ncbi:MAG: monovalent cation/H+ antiporter complex subunit F [Candidatus Diapherotrites archaeon]|nr:monovalent cation/H+ antiporter complex subunit F [Candidatus Diapherotrites archaeon]
MIPLTNELLACAGALAALMLVCLLRVAKGPTAPDRVVAADAINTMVVVAMVLIGGAFREVIYIDIAIIYSMLSFASTLFIAKHLEANA